MHNHNAEAPEDLTGFGVPLDHDRRLLDKEIRSATLLVVEDDPDIRDLVIEALSERGYRVLSAADGNAALAVLRREPGIDLLFTDVVMPGGLNGTQLADMAIKMQPHIKVLLASGYANQAALGLISARHSRTFISKPYRPRQLAARIEGLLEA